METHNPKTRLRMRQIRKGCYVPTLAFIGYIRWQWNRDGVTRGTHGQWVSRWKRYAEGKMFWLQGLCKSRSASSCTVKIDWISDCSFETITCKGDNCSKEQTDLEDREVSSLHPFQMIRGVLGLRHGRSLWRLAIDKQQASRRLRGKVLL